MLLASSVEQKKQTWLSNDTTIDLDGHLLDLLADGSIHNKTHTNINEKNIHRLFDETVQLSLIPTLWREQLDRHLYMSLPVGRWLDTSRTKSVIELSCRIGKSHTSSHTDVTNATDKEKEKEKEFGFVGIFFDDNSFQFLIIDEDLTDLEITLGRAIASCSGENTIVEVYVAPNESAKTRRDKWWNNSYIKIKSPRSQRKMLSNCPGSPVKTSAAYMHYRDHIDDVLLHAVMEHWNIDDGESGGGGEKGSGKGNGKSVLTKGIRIAELCAGDDGESGGGGEKGSGKGNGKSVLTKGIRIAELCAGDGSFAAKILSEKISKDIITSYVLYERNKSLSYNSSDKLSKWNTNATATATVTATANATSHAQKEMKGLLSLPVVLGNEEKKKETDDQEEETIQQKKYCDIRFINVDVYDEKGEESLITLETKPNVWVASGSVLCGQVGNHEMAESTLRGMSESLATNGIIVITGYTQTFLTPQILDRIGFKIIRGSLPSREAGGLESGFGRFHMFVLEKVNTMQNNGVLRSVLLGV